DGLRKVIELSALVAVDLELPGWRQHGHLSKKIKNLHREIARVSASKSPKSAKKLKKLYAKLLKRTERILGRAEKLVQNAIAADLTNLSRVHDIRVYNERIRQVASTAYRRVILGENVPNEDKLFSIFEPHTQLYRRGKAAQENQFGRLAMVCEDGAGLITHHYLMRRNEQDVDVAVPQTKILQNKLNGAIEEISFDRGYYSDGNEKALKELVQNPCLPKRSVSGYTEQMKDASVRFRAARQRHSGVESAIGALQSGNGAKRCRDRTEMGFERYLCLAILGRNLHVLGKMLIARAAPDSLAAQSERQSAA
ncbi:MAG: ISNCY family transposase, partial [bacterium]